MTDNQKDIDAIERLKKMRMFKNSRFWEVVLALKGKGIVYTDADLAKNLGFTRSVISNVKKGQVEPSGNLIKAFVNTFNVNAEYINVGKGELIAPARPDGEMHISERALLKVLYDHVAKLESKVYNKPINDCIDGIEDDTMLKLKSLLPA